MVRGSGVLVAALVMLLCLLCTKGAYGQFQIRHQVPTVLERGSTVELTFDAPGINPGNVQDAFLFYRLNGSVAYQQERARLDQSVFRVNLEIPSGNATILEYYLQVQFNDGSRLVYPVDAPSGNPVRVEIVDQRRAESPESSGELEGIEYTILSPRQRQQVLPHDVVIAITLFYDEAVVDTASSSFRLLLDGTDVTKEAEVGAYFLSYVPEVLEEGLHSVSLMLQTKEASKEIVSWTFTVSETASTPALENGPVSEAGWMPEGYIELGGRNQMLAGNSSDVLSGNFRLSGREGTVRYQAYGLLTSQEDVRLQPQNRYGAELYIGNWLELQAGHVYPFLSPLTIAGQRIQGINIGLHPFDQAIHVQFLYGKLRREVSNLYGPVQVQPQIINGVTVDTSYTLSLLEDGYGTFQRDVLGGRLGFGRGQNFQLGFNLLKVQDDTSSLALVRDYHDLATFHPEMVQDLSAGDRARLEAEPALLNVQGNPQPKGNFVAGTDLSINLHDNRIQFQANGAVSLLNEDISGGILSQERADELGLEIDPELEDLLDRLSWLIIVNENMSTLPLRFRAEGDEAYADVFFPNGILATESELSANYLGNNLRLQYRWVGPDFNSLANSTVRKDIAGYTVSDRFRLLKNRVYVTLGYENLNDNVINNRDATTNTKTLRGNITWYPISYELPRVSLGLMSRIRKNGIELFNPFVASSLQQVALRNYTEQDGEFVIAPNPRRAGTMQFTSSVSQQFELLGLTHDASLNYSHLNTMDDVFDYGNARSSSLSFNLTNRFGELPLDTRMGFSLNSTQTGSGLTDINIFGLNLGGSMLLLDNKLSLDAALAFTRNHSEVTPLTINENGTPDDRSDDYYVPDAQNQTVTRSRAYIFSASARYAIDRNHALLMDMRFANVANPLSNVPFPNDRLVQARYIFSF